MTRTAQTYRARIGSMRVDLPVVDLGNGTSIALLMTIDHGVRFIETAGSELAELIRHTEPEVIVTAATLGIPLAVEVTRSLGLDDYVVLQKSRKIHLDDALTEPVLSITSHGKQALLLDRARSDAVAGKRAFFVDDVLSTGASATAALNILDRVGASIVGAGFLLEEGTTGRALLAERGIETYSLGTIPLLRSGR